MNKFLFVLPILALSFASCDQQTPKPNASYNADNTGKNVRDRDGVLPTADNQSESAKDRLIIQNIREEVQKSSLSTNAKNIKIISIDGKVFLRGPVNSEAEKSELGNIAKRASGVANVNNQLEVVNK